MTDDEEVYVVTGNNRARNGIYHADPDCPCLQLSERVKPKPRSAFPETLRPCRRCTDPVSRAGETQDQSAQRALKRAAAESATAPEGVR